MYDRGVLKDLAKGALRRNYWKSVLVGLLMIVGTGGAATPTVKVNVGDGGFSIKANFMPVLDSELFQRLLFVAPAVVMVVLVLALLLSFFVMNPLMVGIGRFNLVNAQQPAALDELGCGFGSNYKSSVKTMFVMQLYIVLWSLLLVIPGFVAQYRYRMVPYILAEHPELPTSMVLQKSRDMMKGQKWNAFVLDLSFVGWILLSGLTFGLLGLFFTTPYKMQTDANLYLLLSRGSLDGVSGQNA